MEKSTAGQKFVQYALEIGAIELVPDGRALKSGRMSPYFFNSGLFSTGRSLGELAKAYAGAVYTDEAKYGRPEVLFGPAYKGIPLVAAIAVVLGNSIEYAFNRKEVKDHGEGGNVVGATLEDKFVLLVDDVMTTGTSIIEAADIVKKEGGLPMGCVIAFDRQEWVTEGGGSAVQEFEQKYNIPVRAGATLDDLIHVLVHIAAESSDGKMYEVLEKVLAYKKQYGVT